MEFRRCTTVDAIDLASMNQKLIHDEGHRNRMTIDWLTMELEYTESLQSVPDHD